MKSSFSRELSRVHVKSLNINCDAGTAYQFISKPENLPRWATINVQSVRPINSEWYVLDTPIGEAKFRFRLNPEYGILDHDFESKELSWNVSMRVVPNGKGCHLMAVFFQPANLTDSFFDDQMKLMDREFDMLRVILERYRRS